MRLRTKTICGDWGYRYIKTDGMWTGMATAIAYINEGYKEDNLGEAKLANPDMTHVEAYRTGVRDRARNGRQGRVYPRLQPGAEHAHPGPVDRVRRRDADRPR